VRSPFPSGEKSGSRMRTRSAKVPESSAIVRSPSPSSMNKVKPIVASPSHFPP
jgi:hypothetical protein